MSPFFSVIISVYNKATHISATIASVIEQSFTDFEIIIINDGSTDGSKKILDQLQDLILEGTLKRAIGALLVFDLTSESSF